MNARDFNDFKDSLLESLGLEYYKLKPETRYDIDSVARFYNEILSNEFDRGYDVGYHRGYEEGYDSGREDGYNDGLVSEED